MGDPITAAAISAGGSLLGGLFGKGKKNTYESTLNPQAQGVSDQMAQYISGGINKPHAYAPVNQMSIKAMDMLSRMFFGSPYSYNGPTYTAQGGGPSPYGMPQQTGPQYPPMPFPGGPQGQQGTQGPRRGFYGPGQQSR